MNPASKYISGMNAVMLCASRAPAGRSDPLYVTTAGADRVDGTLQ